jgi:hypothetical protein
VLCNDIYNTWYMTYILYMQIISNFEYDECNITCGTTNDDIHDNPLWNLAHSHSNLLNVNMLHCLWLVFKKLSLLLKRSFLILNFFAFCCFKKKIVMSFTLFSCVCFVFVHCYFYSPSIFLHFSAYLAFL